MRRLVFVGSMNYHIAKYYKKAGWSIGLLSDIDVINPADGKGVGRMYKKYMDFIFPVNMTSKTTIHKSLSGFYLPSNTILYTNQDRYLLPRAYIAEFLGIKTNKFLTVDNAVLLTSKFKQREQFNKICPEITVPYKHIETFHGAYLFSRKHGFPIIVKPVHLSQSQLVDVCYNLEDLIKKVSYILAHVKEAYLANNMKRKPMVMVEKFITGKQYSVDSYVDKEGVATHTPVCEQTISKELGEDGFETAYSGYPANIDSTLEQKIYDTCNNALEALQVKGNPSHIEVKVTPEGEVKIIEANLRVGGFRDKLLGAGYHIPHLVNSVKTAIGEEVQLGSAQPLQFVTAPQLWAEKVGNLKGFENLDKVKQLDSYISVYADKKKIGKVMGPADKGFPKVFHAILGNTDKKQLKKDLDWVRQNIHVIVE